MATNEQRARLVGSRSFYQERDGYGEVVDTRPLSYDTDLNACAELRRYVGERGKTHEFWSALFYALFGGSTVEEAESDGLILEDAGRFLDATPQQICAAFDAVFKDELEKIQ